MPGVDVDMTRRNKTPRPLSDDERARLEEFIDSIHYSARYGCIAACGAASILVADEVH